MKLLEGLTFLTLAGGLHVAVLNLTDLPGGAAGGGDGGQASFTLAAAPEQLSDLVAQWDSAPTIAETPELTAPSVETAALTPPIADTQAPRATAAPQLIPQPSAEDAPQFDTRLPTPPGMTGESPQNLSAPQSPDRPLPSMQLQAPPLAGPQALALPQAPSAPEAPDVPQIDTNPASSPMAVAHSRRPVPRPETLAPAPSATPSSQPKPKAQSAARPAQRAAGGGGGKTAANPATKPQPASGPSKSAIRQAQAQWQAQIRRAMASAQRYPRGTRDQGAVKVQISLSPKGRLQSARVTQSSGSAALDKAALDAARRARFPRAPAALGDASYHFAIPLNFKR
ncbi:TonB family protein [Primorskyibacter sp. 2E233]|uniref:TonB family protein n=1 Tax=Primorskyibacter sp. 2E233 TaxID=3413431 RepID=UPI003BF2A274